MPSITCGGISTFYKYIYQSVNQWFLNNCKILPWELDLVLLMTLNWIPPDPSLASVLGGVVLPASASAETPCLLLATRVCAWTPWAVSSAQKGKVDIGTLLVGVQLLQSLLTPVPTSGPFLHLSFQTFTIFSFTFQWASSLSWATPPLFSNSYSPPAFNSSFFILSSLSPIPHKVPNVVPGAQV